jgi:hypothetical protein
MSVSYDEVLVSGSEKELGDYMYDSGKNIVVDWRGDDDEIVKEIAAQTNEQSLSAEYTDDELKIYFNDSEYDLPYELFELSEKARYVTIRKVQELLNDKYEIRTWRESMLSDTHSLYVKSKDWWKFMDEKFPARMDQLFVKIDENTQFF